MPVCLTKLSPVANEFSQCNSRFELLSSSPEGCYPVGRHPPGNSQLTRCMFHFPLEFGSDSVNEGGPSGAWYLNCTERPSMKEPKHSGSGSSSTRNSILRPMPF